VSGAIVILVIAMSDIGSIVVNTINEVLNDLPYGHACKTDRFAQEILSKVFETLRKKKEITPKEAKELVFSLTSRLRVL
jgi:hypothetical protein